MSKLKAGDRVKAKATCFDQEGHPRWSEAAFGSQWKTSFCSGSLVKTVGRGAAEVVWDIDGSVTKVPVAVLSVNESTEETDSFRSSSASDDHNPDFSESPSSSEEEEDSPASADSSDDSEGTTSDLTVDPRSNVHESATASSNGLSWHFQDEILENAYQGTSFSRPRLDTENPQAFDEIGYWKLFFPVEEIDHILSCTNKKMPEKKKAVSQNKLYKVFGILYAMTTANLPTRRSYWGVEDGVFPAPALADVSIWDITVLRTFCVHLFLAILMVTIRNRGERKPTRAPWSVDSWIAATPHGKKRSGQVTKSLWMRACLPGTARATVLVDCQG